MAGHKHPRIFAERGSASWGELWDHLGPLADQVFTGLSIAKEDGKELCIIKHFHLSLTWFKICYSSIV